MAENENKQKLKEPFWKRNKLLLTVGAGALGILAWLGFTIGSNEKKPDFNPAIPNPDDIRDINDPTDPTIDDNSSRTVIDTNDKPTEQKFVLVETTKGVVVKVDGPETYLTSRFSIVTSTDGKLALQVTPIQTTEIRTMFQILSKNPLTRLYDTLSSLPGYYFSQPGALNNRNVKMQKERADARNKLISDNPKQAIKNAQVLAYKYAQNGFGEQNDLGVYYVRSYDTMQNGTPQEIPLPTGIEFVVMDVAWNQAHHQWANNNINIPSDLKTGLESLLNDSTAPAFVGLIKSALDKNSSAEDKILLIKTLERVFGLASDDKLREAFVNALNAPNDNGYATASYMLSTMSFPVSTQNLGSFITPEFVNKVWEYGVKDTNLMNRDNLAAVIRDIKSNPSGVVSYEKFLQIAGDGNPANEIYRVFSTFVSSKAQYDEFLSLTNDQIDTLIKVAKKECPKITGNVQDPRPDYDSIIADLQKPPQAIATGDEKYKLKEEHFKFLQTNVNDIFVWADTTGFYNLPNVLDLFTKQISFATHATTSLDGFVQDGRFLFQIPVSAAAEKFGAATAFMQSAAQSVDVLGGSMLDGTEIPTELRLMLYSIKVSPKIAPAKLKPGQELVPVFSAERLLETLKGIEPVPATIRENFLDGAAEPAQPTQDKPTYSIKPMALDGSIPLPSGMSLFTLESSVLTPENIVKPGGDATGVTPSNNGKEAGKNK